MAQKRQLRLVLGNQVGQCQELNYDALRTLPQGLRRGRVAVRAKAAEIFSRGNVYATLTVTREGVAPVVRINEPVLNAMINAIGNLSGRVDAGKAAARRPARSRA